AAAAVDLRFPVAGVVAGDLVALHDQRGDRRTAGVGVHPVLAVAAQAVAADLLARARHQAGAVVVLDGRVLDHPAVAGVVVDHAFVAGRGEALDGQVGELDVRPVAGEGVLVDLPAVDDRAGGADVDVAVLGRDLVVLVVAEDVLARLEPERWSPGCWSTPRP